LKSLAKLSYPQDYYAVCVVADNCTDGTAALVHATGWAHVYERSDASKRGKGYALHWLLQRLEDEQVYYDAYVILDADSVVNPNFLSAMSQGFTQGVQALQGYSTVLNISESPGTALRWIALTLVNYVRPLGRSALGGSSTLNGNGMCLSRSLLQRYPWNAFSVTEDYQYYLNLVLHGERVGYVPDAVVPSHMPPSFAHMRSQDVRWESSDTGQTTWQTAWKLLSTGLRHRDFVRIEAALELITPPLSLLVGICVLLLVLALFAHSGVVLVGSILLVLGLLCYIGTPFCLARPPLTVYKALLYAPRFIVWKLWVYCVVSRRKTQTQQWVPTARTISTE
jgi:cellulose synthase/poly-beta-1,6-N-acetylglucosamine synthase-like glycosyltransferase